MWKEIKRKLLYPAINSDVFHKDQSFTSELNYDGYTLNIISFRRAVLGVFS